MQKEIRELLTEKIDEVYYYFQEKMGITSGYISLDLALEQNILVDKLVDSIQATLEYERSLEREKSSSEDDQQSNEAVTGIENEDELSNEERTKIFREELEEHLRGLWACDEITRKEQAEVMSDFERWLKNANPEDTTYCYNGLEFTVQKKNAAEPPAEPNELMITTDTGWMYYKTFETTVVDAYASFLRSLEIMELNVDNINFRKCVLRDSSGNDVGEIEL